MNYLDMVAVAAININLEVLPEQLVFVTFVPSLSVVGGLIGGAIALVRRLGAERRAVWAEMGALVGGAVGVAAFIGAFLLKEVL